MRRPELYASRPPKPSTCPVLTVPPWMYDMTDLGSQIASGQVSLKDVSAGTYAKAQTAYAAVQGVRVASEAAERKRREGIAAAVRKVKGGDR